MSKAQNSRLAKIGVYGFDEVETVVLAALVTQDPLLLIGDTGTGKTFLLNSLSEVLGLEHRHYNASLISFDDLVGFPYPDTENGGVKFLETPATVWGAESVLIDEISRCKPEHQNRLFSLIHERRLQGILLSKLKFRWAAMNPCSSDQTSHQEYSGSEPLDPALADRFSLFVRAVDWNDLSDDEKRHVAHPKGDGEISNDGGRLKQEVCSWRKEFEKKIKDFPPEILTYVTTAATLFISSKVRISPRRTRVLCRSLLAATIVTGQVNSKLFKLVLTCSLPQVTWGEEIKPGLIAAVHQTAWESATLKGERKWANSFHLIKPLSKKLEFLVNECPSPDAGTQAVEQLLANEPPERSAVFAFAAALQGKIPIGAEAINDLGRIASPIFSVDGEITWQQTYSAANTKHPEFVRYAAVLKGLKGARRERATQLFNWCLVSRIILQNPSELEKELNECFSLIQSLY